MKNEIFISALLVGEYKDDRLLLREIFQDAGWRLLEAADKKKALAHLERDPIHVVIAHYELRNWHWKKVLANLLKMVKPPQLIVTSRLADEHLWSEVLNCGGYDVLPQPFQREEIERVIASARRQYDRFPTWLPAHQRPFVA